MSAQKLDTEVRQEQIARAALNLIASRGVKGVTVGGVARQVGIVPSAIYRHFRSKDDVLDAILDLIGDRLLGNVAAAREETSDPLESLRRLLMRHVQLIREYQAIPLIIFSEEVYSGHSGRKGKLHGIISTFLNKIAEIVCQGQQEGKIRRDVAPETLAVSFLGLFQPSAFLWHLSDGAFDMVKQTEAAWRIFSDALKPRNFFDQNVNLNSHGS